MTKIYDFIEETFDLDIEDEYVELDDLDNRYIEDATLAEVCDTITENYLEDYSFEELLEEFDVAPGLALFILVKSGVIEPYELQAYLVSDR